MLSRKPTPRLIVLQNGVSVTSCEDRHPASKSRASTSAAPYIHTRVRRRRQVGVDIPILYYIHTYHRLEVGGIGGQQERTRTRRQKAGESGES